MSEDRSDNRSSSTRRTIAHLSDLHIGQDERTTSVSEALAQHLGSNGTDLVIVTGDITDHGKEAEYAEFRRIFAPLIDADRLTVLPGNHDRCTDDIGNRLMDGPVEVTRFDGVYLIRIDTTATYNRFVIPGQGRLSSGMNEKIATLAADARDGELVVVGLHHHLYPQEEDYLSERISTLLRLPFAEELKAGPALLGTLLGRCDVVLHGHRHRPLEHITHGERDLRVYNAGSTTGIGKYRLFTHADGKLVGKPEWMILPDV